MRDLQLRPIKAIQPIEPTLIPRSGRLTKRRAHLVLRLFIASALISVASTNSCDRTGQKTEYRIIIKAIPQRPVPMETTTRPPSILRGIAMPQTQGCEKH